MKSIVFTLTPDAAGGKILDPRDPTGGNCGGGSRAGFMGLVRAMGRTGKYKVTALSTFRDVRATVDGVQYVRIDRSREVEVPDVHFAYYETTPLIGSKAKMRIASHHTCVPTHTWCWNDINLAPSQWAVDHLRNNYRPHGGRWHVLPNAVDGLEGFVRNPIPGRVIHHGSPDRGVHNLFAMWPRIKRAVPRATLHVSGNLDEVMQWADAPQFKGS